MLHKDHAASDAARASPAAARRPSGALQRIAAMLPAAQPKRLLIRPKDPFERFQESTRDAWSADDDELTAKATLAYTASPAAGAATTMPPDGSALRRLSSASLVSASDSLTMHVVNSAPALLEGKASGSQTTAADATEAVHKEDDDATTQHGLSVPSPVTKAVLPTSTIAAPADARIAAPADARRPSAPPTVAARSAASADESFPDSLSSQSAVPRRPSAPPSGPAPRVTGETDLSPAPSVAMSSKQHAENARVAKLMTLLNAGSSGSSSSSNTVDLGELRQTSWSGVPARMRPLVWKLLSGYLPAVVERRATTLERKRREYFGFVDQYYGTRFDPEHQETFRQIQIDIPRMSPSLPFLQDPAVQEIFERILYIWAIRHPASGYVQGMNDLVTPFFVAFMCEYTNTAIDGDTALLPALRVLLSTEQQRALEADCFWCVSKLLGGVQDNYVFAQPGIQKKVLMLKELVAKADGGVLCKHLELVGVEFLQFSFRWMNNLLLRELPLRCCLQLWDTYHAEADGFASFHLYVCAALLMTFAGQLLKQVDFQGLMTLLQNLPTEQWGESEIRELVAKAYQLKCTFAMEAILPQLQQQHQVKPTPVAV